jgi:hydroxyacylglutathione hydrolase
MMGEAAPVPLDVRFRHEWREGHVPGAVHVELGALPGHLDGLPRDRAYATLCAAGVRASTAASILQREGFQDVSLVLGGTQAWEKAHYPLDNQGA